MKTKIMLFTIKMCNLLFESIAREISYDTRVNQSCKHLKG